MSAADQMALRDRKAFALRNAFVSALNRTDPSASSETLKLISDRINFVAKHEHSEQASDARPADKFLRDALEMIERFAAGFDQDADYGEIKKLVSVFRDELFKVDCIACSGVNICCGRDGVDKRNVAEQSANCVSSIKDAVKEAHTIASAFYEKFARTSVPAVRIVMSTRAVDGFCGQIPGRPLAINGKTSFKDDDDAKTSVVEISVSPSLWNIGDVFALKYVALHELLCHAFQMARNASAREKKGGIVDPISEGMLDAVAVALIEKQSEDLASSGASDFADRETEARMAMELHLARCVTTLDKPFPEARQVLLGSRCLKLITALYQLDSARELAGRDAARLAADLNLAGWGFAKRMRGASRLVLGLTGSTRDTAVIRALVDYRLTHDVENVIKTLISD